MVTVSEHARAARLAVAPMMEWTDRHCRAFHRVLSRRALLYTEMITARAVVHGDAERLIGHDPAEEPVALQLGGSEPEVLHRAAALAAELGWRQIDLNCGCPSDRVQSGAFGAVLMRTPDLVADCLRAMAEGAGPGVEITVKCRIGVDDDEPAEVLPRFLEAVSGAGVRRVTVHARKAWLKGLSPKDNREIPPLDHALVHRMKAAFPALHLSINGGIDSLEAAAGHLAAGMDGVMIGRAAYHRPWDILARTDSRLFGAPDPVRSRAEAVRALRPHIERHLAGGGRLHDVTRHMLGLFHGCRGARRWRRMLAEEAVRPGAGPELLERALTAMGEAAEAA